MSEVRGVVVAHGNLASCLVDTAEGIAGVSGGLLPISNTDCGPDELERRVRDALADGPTIVFVDLATGSCARAARAASREVPAASVVTGVNLPMLLDFVFHREMELSRLAQRLIVKGHAGTKAFLPDMPA